MCYYISHYVTRGAKTFEGKVSALRDFVHRNIHPIEGYDDKIDEGAIDTLLSGTGYCDQQSRVFIHLARSIGITSRLLFLESEGGGSLHAVAEALAPDKRWVIIAPLYRLGLFNKEGKFASQADIKDDPGIIMRNNRVVLRSKYDPRWLDPKFVAIYYNPPQYIMTKRGIKFDFFKAVPLELMRPIINIIQNRYFQQLKPAFKGKYEFKMLEAHGYYLLGYYDKSGNLYREIIKDSNNLVLIHQAEFHYAVSLRDRGRYQEAERYINEVIEKDRSQPYLPYLLGLKGRILEKIGRDKEADETFRQAEYALEI